MNAFSRIRPYAFLTLLFLAILLVSHHSYLRLPYFWDEAGQFIPAALDIYEHNSWIPSSTLPNIHPPGLMALLAGVWKLVGAPSIFVTRVAMLTIAAFGLTGSFALAVRLTQGSPGLPAFGAIAALLVSPLVFTQSMMAQLDFPALALTAWALFLFLEERHAWSAAVCVLLVLTKETGVLVPLICCGWLIAKRRDVRDAVWYALPVMALMAWITLLWLSTGSPFGNREFADYNTSYALHPVRAAAALARRVYYLFFAEFRWIGALPLLFAWRAFRSDAWRVAGLFAAAHTLAVSLLGGATLERYLLPALPIVYAAMGTAWGRLPGIWKFAAPSLAGLGLLVSLYLPPLLPAPFENNLAMVDLVELHQSAAEFVVARATAARVATAWPLTDALRRPELGYVAHGIDVLETKDFRAANVLKLDPSKFDVLITYDRTRESTYSFLKSDGVIRRFLQRFYDFEPQVTGPQIERAFRMYSVMRIEKRGQWVEVWMRPIGAARPY